MPVRLVIVDDDPKLAGMVGTIARDVYPDPDEVPIESHSAAEAALGAIRRFGEKPDGALVVISDFHLPPSSVDGIQILEEVRRRVPSAKRVLMTGRDPDEFAHLLAQAQLDAFVEKPFAFDEMRSLIRRLVSSADAAGADAGAA